MAFVGRKPTNAPLTADDIPNGIIGAADLASGISGLITWQSVQTTGFTAVAGRGYPCNTTSAAFTVTLPASPSVGDTIILLDYAGTFDTNALTISPNGNKIEGVTLNLQLTGDREGVTLVYIDSTQGWLASSGIQEGTDALSPTPYSVDFLVIAGGGAGGFDQGGGGGAGGYRNSFSTETSGGGGTSETELTFTPGTVYTITVGAGGAGVGSGNGASGVASSISGSNITTITSAGGGGAGGLDANGISGGSGGGGAGNDNNTPNTTGGTGTANQGFNGESRSGATQTGGGGGGAGEAGGTDGVGQGGDGLASSITGSSVSRGGGGGSGIANSNTSRAGGDGGGGAGGGDSNNPANVSGTANTGGGGGGGHTGANTGSGGSGVVILRMPTANYSGTTTGSPTVTTDGSDKVIVFTGSGSITG